MPFQSHVGKPNGKNAPKKFQDTAANVMNQTKQVASAFSQKAEEATHTVGNRLKSWAETVREQGPHEGVMGNATCSLADTIETSGDYLQRKSLTGIVDDVTNIVRRNPLPALLVGVSFGVLLAHATRRR